MHSVDHTPPPRQRGPHNDPTLLDGDSAHGSPDVLAGDEWAVDTDTDVVDAAPDDPLEEAVDEHTPDAEAERNEEDSQDGIVTTGTGDVEDEDEPAVEETDETDLGADDDRGGEDAAYREIDAEGDARGPEPDETTLEVELNRRAQREPSAPAKRPPQGFVGHLPTEDYLSLTVPQVLEQVAGMDAAQLAAVLEFERANKNRKTLVAKLERMTRS